ncbi:acyl-CoA thioesterase [Adhaeribacter sp. BT258]|uniref:Acyl-CoA thioesterase n=1 Tax=Adhaeribacter terrigena TaxID=2793070 RepID=A0ABS1BX21_9BACT|nr:acyl-CoA thioesterase [Adhaeribacter terrigena]MBK0401558.1 acyl-CoA thioesterase [Adhaeribacter terrigena]
MENYPVKLNIRLDWSEMDLFGHINNVSYFKYIQASRVNYWDAIGLTQLFKATKTGAILASTNCNFLKGLHYPGEITVQVKLDFVKNTSFGLKHQLLNEHGQVAAEAKDVLVMFDFAKNEKVPIPENIRAQMTRLEEELPA